MVLLNDQIWFPNVDEAGEEGLLAVGGDLSQDRLRLAYQSGIFPWYSEGEPILWWSPNPRMVLFLNEFKVSKSLQRRIRQDIFEVSTDTAFSEVIWQCAKITRPGQEDTWITQDMIRAYEKLHQMGHARSVEIWQEGELVGGMYGIDLPEKKVFCGESMFSKVNDASKIALYQLVKQLKEKQYVLIDCQVYTAHLARMGAREIPREKFMDYLK